jgi:alkylhydroperoxidase family enzyme
MAHVTLIERPTSLIPRLAARYGRRRFGRAVEPVMAASHHRGVLVALGALEAAVDKGWKRLDPRLRWLAIQAAAGEIGCSWCTDFGYYEGMNAGIDPQKVRAVPEWRESTLFDARERAVLEYAESATMTPAEVSGECADRLHAHFTDAEIVELAAWVALENFRSRFNAGLGLRSQGFAEQCALPMSLGADGVATVS